MAKTKTTSAASNDEMVVAKLTTTVIDSENLRKTVEAGKRILICTIYGYASAIKMVKDRIRDEYYHALAGDFEATYEHDGKRTRSGVLYLPGGVHELVEKSLKELTEEGQVAFAFQLFATKADNPQGYTWLAKSLIKPEEADPMDELRKKLTGLVKEEK